MVGKVFERVVTDIVCYHLSDNYLLSDQWFLFGPGHSISDTLMVIIRACQATLDDELVQHCGCLLDKLSVRAIQDSWETTCKGGPS